MGGSGMPAPRAFSLVYFRRNKATSININDFNVSYLSKYTVRSYSVIAALPFQIAFQFQPALARVGKLLLSLRFICPRFR